MSSGISIGELAALVRAKPSAIRYYEAEGIIPKAGRRSGRRVYGADDILRLKMVVAARELGFSIAEIRAMVEIDAESLRGEASRQAIKLRLSIAELSLVADRMEKLSQCECRDEKDCRLASV